MDNYKKTFSIRQWNEDDRPREKLMLKGKIALSDAELIAILIGSGNREETAVDLAKRILNSVDNNLNQLAKLNVENLCEFKGIGEAKAISIITALEIGKRRRLEQALINPKITSSKSVFNVMQPIIAELDHEEFWVLFLNNSNIIINKQQVSKGGITSTLVDVRVVLKKAIELSAVGIVLCHNHPSGKRDPSDSDKKLTKKFVAASNLLDIQVLDHIIVTQDTYYSFADNSLMRL